MGVGATQIGPYTIDHEIGRGGMGVVYLARDSRLDRFVAIKALPEEFASDNDRLERFEREAKALAQLNHPNIAQIYGVEAHEGVTRLVLEYVPGETLAQRLDHGSLAVEEAMEVCAQIARGLEAAHEQGVVHRDLKPSNIKITVDEKVKALDFGLAKTDNAHSSSSAALSAAVTLTSPVAHSPTIPGVILGTAPYMSPEQARGRSIDKRTDIWSFGVVLYECLTGGNPFLGESATDSIGAILHKDVNFNRLPPSTPAVVRHVLARCLERDKTKRLRDIGDARIELERALAGDVSLDANASQTRFLTVRSMLLLAGMAALGAGLALGASWTFFTPQSADVRPIRLTMSLYDKGEMFTGIGPDFALSRDGLRLAYAIAIDDVSRLFIRDLTTNDTKELEGTKGAHAPFFSPDGAWVAFFTATKLKKIAVEGGVPVALCSVSGLSRGGAWTNDGAIVFAPGTADGISRIDAEGGDITQLTTLDANKNERSHRWPQAIPGQDLIVFTSLAKDQDFNDSSIEVVDLNTAKRTVLHEGGAFGRVTSTGVLLFARAGALYACMLDPSRTRVVTPPKAVLYDLESSGTNGGAQFAFSQTGVLLYLQGSQQDTAQTQPTWVGFDGARMKATPSPGLFDAPALSPDSARVAFAEGLFQDRHIVVHEFRRSVTARVTGTERRTLVPIWSPDGTSLVVSATSENSALPSLFLISVDEEKPARRITHAVKGPHLASDWSRDGESILFSTVNDNTGWDVSLLLLEGDEPVVEPILASPANEGQARFSPDGSWLAYTSDESGVNQVYVRRLTGARTKRQISVNGGHDPRWAPDGAAVYYLGPLETQLQSMLFRVNLTERDGALMPEAPVVLTNLNVAPISTFGFNRYDLDAAGKRVLALEPVEAFDEGDKGNAHIVLHWFDELKRLLADQ